MQLKNYFIILVLAVVVSACSSGKSALNKGDYYAATLQAVSRLRSNPDSDKARQTLIQSYPMAVDYYKQKAEAAVNINSTTKYTDCVSYYTLLNQLADEISRCPAALEVVRPVVYFHSQLATAKTNAAEEQYNLGIQFLKSNTIDDARAAYRCFEKVTQFQPNYKNTNSLMAQALEKAILRVVVEQVPVYSQQYQISAQAFYQRIYSYLKSKIDKKFIQFYLPEEAEKEKIVPHQVIRMQFNDFIVGNVSDKELIEEFTSDSLKVGSVKLPDGSTADVLGVVKAKVRSFHREVRSGGFLNLDIVNYANSEKVVNKNFPGEFIWVSEWATFNGDERAVPKAKIEICKRSQATPPSPQDLFLLFSDPIFASSSSFLYNYYRRQNE